MKPKEPPITPEQARIMHDAAKAVLQAAQRPPAGKGE